MSHISLWNRLKRYLKVCIYFQLVIVIQLVQAVYNVIVLVYVPARLDTPEPHVILVQQNTMIQEVLVQVTKPFDQKETLMIMVVFT